MHQTKGLNQGVKLFLLPLVFLVVLFFPSEAKAAASLSFSPAAKTVVINDSFNVDVILNTGGQQSDGADVIVRYDGNKLTLVSATLGDLYINKLTADTSTAGKVTFRATSSEDQSFTGTGTFATMVFKAAAEGTANLYFDFTSGSTTDSNVAYLGSDILGSTSNASYTITQSGTGGEASAAPSIPESGMVSPTILLLAGGLLLLLVGAVKLAFFSI